MKDRLNKLFRLQTINLVGLALISAAIGLWLIIWPPGFLEKSVAASIGSSILSAVITSGIIGWFFQQRLAKDVFEASLGYLLPDELKPELAWICDQKILCFESLQKYDISIKDNETITVSVEIHRRFRNFSGQAVEFKYGLAITPKGPMGSPSKIHEFGYRISGTNQELNWGDKELANKTTIEPQKIILPSRSEITTWSSHTYEERISADDFVVFSYPTFEPAVSIKTDAEMKHQVNFAYPSRPEAAKQTGANMYRVYGTLLPLQHVHVKWWKE